MAVNVSASSLLLNTITDYARGAALGLAVGITVGAVTLAVVSVNNAIKG